MVHTMLARGQRNAREIATVLLANLAARTEILAVLHAVMGNAFVQQVVSLAFSTTTTEAEPNAAELPAAGPVRITASALRVRTSPTAANRDNITGKLKRGTVVTALAKEGEWLRIEHGGQTAYIHGDYVEAVTPEVTKKKAKPKTGPEDDQEEGDGDPTPVQAPTNVAPQTPTPVQAPDPTPVQAPDPTPVQAADPTPVQAADPAPVQAPDPTPVQAPDPTPVQTPTTPHSPPPGQTQAPDPTPQAPAPTHSPTAQVPQGDKPQLSGSYEGMYRNVYDTGEQKVQVFVSPGGLSKTPNIYLHFHGYYADYGIDDDLEWDDQSKKNKTGKGTKSGIDLAQQAMAKAQDKNTIAILPQGVLGMQSLAKGKEKKKHEGGYMEDIAEQGLPTFLETILTQLGADLGIAGLKPGNIGLGGHSAGGYQGVHTAMTTAGGLADSITDITLMDTAYSETHFKAAAQWMVKGKPGKNLRIVNSYTQMMGNSKYMATWNLFTPEKLAEAAKAHGFTLKTLKDVGEKPDKDTRVINHAQLITKDGDVQCDVLLTMFSLKSGKDHDPLRDRVIDDAIMSVGEGAEGNQDFGYYDNGSLREHDDDHDEDPDNIAPPAPKSKQAPEPQAPTQDAKPKTEPAEAKPEQKKNVEPKAKPKAKSKKEPVDDFGNPTKRVDDREKSTSATFDNSFTVVSNGAIYHGETSKKSFAKLQTGTEVWVVNVGAWRVQIRSADYKAEDNVWIPFAYLGGTGADVGLGNERGGDAEEKARADKIREGLPEGRKPGQSKYTWGFGGRFNPSLDGISLDGSLMSKVHRLMEWAIHNDMVLGNITITSGMRSPALAHKLCVRYELANVDKRHKVSLESLKALPGGKDKDGNVWWKPEFKTLDDAMEYARSINNKGRGKPAAAGYASGDKRAPLNDNSPGVSRHCSGHAVDVNIPWRSAKDPTEKDLWGWEHIYHQFGLTRPLHRSITSPAQEESWHIEETGKALEVEGELKDDDE